MTVECSNSCWCCSYCLAMGFGTDVVRLIMGVLCVMYLDPLQVLPYSNSKIVVSVSYDPANLRLMCRQHLIQWACTRNKMLAPMNKFRDKVIISETFLYHCRQFHGFSSQFARRNATETSCLTNIVSCVGFSQLPLTVSWSIHSTN